MLFVSLLSDDTNLELPNLILHIEAEYDRMLDLGGALELPARRCSVRDIPQCTEQVLRFSAYSLSILRLCIDFVVSNRQK